MNDRLDEMEMPGRQARLLTEDGVSGRVELSEYVWHYDEPPEKGGSSTAPTPVDHLLGSLSACFAVTLRTEASKHDFDFNHLDITANARPETGFVEEIYLAIQIATKQPADQIETVLTHTERSCNILKLIREDVPVTIEFEQVQVNAADGSE